MRQIESDVIVVGYGPVGRILALLLGQQGHRVTVLERHRECYPLPRAVCMDHEIRRLLTKHGFADKLDTVSVPSPRYMWLNQKWETLLDIDWTIESISGGPQAYFFYQPALEQAMGELVEEQPTVERLLGYEVLNVTQDESFTSVQARDEATGELCKVRARYLIGADGANSIVRKAMCVEWKDLGFQADWLVVDVMLNDGVVLDIPPAGQHCNPERPTTFVPGGIKDGRPLRRWEIMRLPQETQAQLLDTEYVWRLLERWVRRDQAELVRHAVYTFRSLVAETWQQGRFFIAGDAAHLMPPFMGQGMCSGLRDATNLAWRLDRVLKAQSTPELLEAYEIERKPHITSVIESSIYLGNIVCVADPEAAAKRDQAFLEGTHPPPAPFPHLLAGTLSKGLAPHAVEQATPARQQVGQLTPHAQVGFAGEQARLDALTGSGFFLLFRSQAGLVAIPQYAFERLERLGVKALYLAEQAGDGGIEDLSGKLRGYLDENAFSSMLVRPDFYLFGAAADADQLIDLIQELASELHATTPHSAATRCMVTPTLLRA
jgi:2-polyprenyl-6-methoxyphenol hydroxylase-like FAD-dependent oxidoreductase